MANYVTTIITIPCENPQILAKVTQVFDKQLNEAEDFYKAIFESDTFQNGEPVNTGYGQYAEEIGAKWCYMDNSDISDYNSNIVLDSAWSFPDGAFKQIYQLVANIDPNILISCTYKDEAYNFIGAAAYGPNGYHNLEQSELEQYPDEDEIPEDEYDEAVEQWETNMDEELGFLEQTCIKNATKKNTKKK